MTPRISCGSCYCKGNNLRPYVLPGNDEYDAYDDGQLGQMQYVLGFLAALYHPPNKHAIPC